MNDSAKESSLRFELHPEFHGYPMVYNVSYRTKNQGEPYKVIIYNITDEKYIDFPMKRLQKNNLSEIYIEVKDYDYNGNGTKLSSPIELTFKVKLFVLLFTFVKCNIRPTVMAGVWERRLKKLSFLDKTPKWNISNKVQLCK